MKTLKPQGRNGLILKTSAGAGLLAASAASYADTISEIGTKAAEAIAGFTVAVSAIGLAAIAVIVAIQGFRMAFSMIKSVR